MPDKDGMLEFSSIGKIDLNELDVRFKYPKEWTNVKKPDGTNTAIFGEPEGSGNKGFMTYMLVNIWPQPRTDSKEVARTMSQDDFRKIFLWPGQSLEKFEDRQYDGLDGHTLTIKRPLEDAGEVPVYKMVHMVPVGNCMVILQCCLVPDGEDKELQSENLIGEVKKAETLFRKMGDSLKLENKDEFISKVMLRVAITEFRNDLYKEEFEGLYETQTLSYKKEPFELSLEVPKRMEVLEARNENIIMEAGNVLENEDSLLALMVQVRIQEFEPMDTFMKADNYAEIWPIFSTETNKEKLIVQAKREYDGRPGVLYISKKATPDSGIIIYFLRHEIFCDKKIVVVSCSVSTNESGNDGAEDPGIFAFSMNVPLFKLVGDSIRIKDSSPETKNSTN